MYEKAKNGTWSELSILFQIVARKVQPLQFLMNQYSCLLHLSVRLSLLSVTRKQVLIATKPEPFQMDEFENDSESDYDETESEEIVEHRYAITRSGRQIKASVRFDQR